MYSLEVLGNIITPLLLMYIFIFIFMYGQRYLRTYSRNKMLKFTQEEVKEKRKEIATIMQGIQEPKERVIPWEKQDYYADGVIKIFSLYNEIAVGINEGLYDELYVKMVMGYEMMDFYKYNYKIVVSTLDTDKNLSRFMPLELLLKRWDSGDAPSYRFNKHRRYL